jgi:hypothetical protein
MKNVKKIILVIIFVAIISIPYLSAAQQSGINYRFSGFLINVQDGNSYLAKMQEGWSGSWSFTLPYTADPGAGTSIFLFYIFLGHVARWLGIPLIWMYHIARVIFAVLLAGLVIEFFQAIHQGKGLWGATLALLGGGLGWVVFATGTLTSDYWVAEAYPFLSAYTNPHFSLGLALLLGAFWLNEKSGWLPVLGLFAASLLLAVLQPFGVVILLVVLIGRALLAWPSFHQQEWIKIIAAGLGGGPWLVYQYWVILNHPVLKIWNAQNITTSPSVLDLLLSFSPALLLALAGVWSLWKNPQQPYRRLLLAWFCLGWALVYLPFGLQRRFMLGLYLPTAALAFIGYLWLAQRRPVLWRRVFTAVIILSLPTNLTILMAGLWGGQSHNPAIYLRTDEAQALGWINEKAPANAVVLASPEMSIFIPAQTGRRVIYGHPFETANAQVEKEKVESFFSGKLSEQAAKDFLKQDKVSYILYGEREKGLGTVTWLETLPLVYQNGSEQIYAVTEQP